MTGSGVIIRAALYFAIALLTPISAEIAECATYGYWPPAVKIISAGLGGIVAGLVALRAYIDGSAERYSNGDDRP